jgi:hypothetical protein
MAGMQVEGTALFEDIQASGQITAATLTTSGSINIGGSGTFIGPISTTSTISGTTITIVGFGTFYGVTTLGPLTSGGTFTADGPSNLNGPAFANGNLYGNGNITEISSPFFGVESKNVSFVTEGVISFNTTDKIFIQVNTDIANRGVCLGSFNSSSYNLTQFCALHYEPVNKTIFVNNLTVVTELDFLNSAGNIQSTVGSAQYEVGFAPAHNNKLLVIDSDLYVNGYGYAKNGFSTSPTSNNFQWDPPHCDKRLKEDIRLSKEEESASLLEKVNIYNFRYKKGIPASRDRPGERRGPIAQELVELLPRAVYEETDGYLSVDYNELIPDLVNANKLLMKELREVKKQLSDLQTKISAIPFSVKEFDSKEERDNFYEKQPRRRPIVNS